MKDDLARTAFAELREECERARLWASAWIDGELAEESVVRAHLARCQECRAHVEELREVSLLLSPLSRGGPELDLWPRILEGTHAVRARSATVWRARASRFAAVLVGFVATGALLRVVSARREEPAAPREPHLATWGAVLHGELPELRGLETTPENQLLAALSAGREVDR